MMQFLSDRKRWFLLALFLLILLLGKNSFSSSLSRFSDITPQEIEVAEALDAWRSSSAVFVDVRTPEEFNSGHIPGSKLIPLPQLKERSWEIPLEAKVILVCRSGKRSADANLLLQKLGFKNTASLRSGIINWPEIQSDD